MKTLLINILYLLTITTQNRIITPSFARKTTQDTLEITDSETSFPEEPLPYTQEDFESKEVEENLIFFSKYQRLMQIATTINKFYNDITNTFPTEQEEGYNADKEIIIFELGRLFINTIINEYNELSEEVNDVYMNLDKLDMTVDGCLEFFNFHEYYNSVVLEIDQNSEGYKEIERELSLTVHEFTFKMRDFFISLDNLRNIHEEMYLFFIPYQNSFESEDIIEKEESGLNVKKAFLTFYRRVIKKTKFIHQGIFMTRSIRKSLLDIIFKIEYLEKAGLPGLQEKGYFNLVFWLGFFVFVFWI